ncbi:hypothetical protein [Pseudomonas hamedanensis]|uniref:Uncharacterized protein n=1 Tax=Pseudomonas hamedanensis TaxID=2745504 RepID=A0A9E6TG28_9PSED|nr:hypothetical protein [Pseudomonas hamedanensis]QXI16249.1 hypothetical protein HU739_020340 [Pseudomonas hamedanensis]
MTNQTENDLELPVLTVLEAKNNSTLAPCDVLSGATTRISFQGVNSRHVVRLVWAGPSEWVHEFTAQWKEDSQSFEVFVPAEVIGLSVGKTIDLSYTASLDGSVMRSKVLRLTVEYISPAQLPEPRLPEIVVEEGTKFLDMRRFAGNPRVQLAPWKFIAPGQRVWMRVVGQRDHPTHETLDLVTALEVTSEQVRNGLELTIDRAWLNGLDYKSALTVETFVTFDKSPNIDAAHELPRWTQLLITSDTDLLAPTVEQVSSGVLDPELVPEQALIIIAFNGMRLTDRITPQWCGTSGEGSPELASVNGSVEGIVKVAVGAAAVIANEGETVEVSYKLMRDGIERPSPITRVTVQKRRYVHLENFDEQEEKIVSVNHNHSFTLPNMSIKLVEGAGSAGVMRFSTTIKGLLEGRSFGMCLDAAIITPPQCIQFDFDADYERISFTWTYLHEKGVVTYFDADGAVLGRNEYLGFNKGGEVHRLIDFVAPAQSRIKSMQVLAEDYSFLDFFTMCG